MIGPAVKRACAAVKSTLPLIIVLNAGFLVSAAIFAVPGRLLNYSAPLAAGILRGAGILWCVLYLAAAARLIAAAGQTNVPEPGRPRLSGFSAALRSALSDGLILGCAVLLAAFLPFRAAPFFFAMNTMPAYFAASCTLWVPAALAFAFQFVPVIRARLPGSLFAALKTSLVIALDNPALCIVSLVVCAAVLALSVFSLLLFPGPAGVLVYLNEIAGALLKKYGKTPEGPYRS
jgi:hypothetical protein